MNHTEHPALPPMTIAASLYYALVADGVMTPDEALRATWYAYRAQEAQRGAYTRGERG